MDIAYQTKCKDRNYLLFNCSRINEDRKPTGDSDWPSKSDAPWKLANFQHLLLFEIMKRIHHLTSLEKLTLKNAIFFFQIITLTVTKEEQLKDVWVVYRYSSSSNLSIGVLQVSVLNGNHISEIKRSINCTASNIHWLQIQLSTRRHQNKTMITIIENETHISDLATRKKEVVQRTERVLREIIDLQRKCKRTCLFMDRGFWISLWYYLELLFFHLKEKKNVFWPYLMLL